MVWKPRRINQRRYEIRLPAPRWWSGTRLHIMLFRGFPQDRMHAFHITGIHTSGNYVHDAPAILANGACVIQTRPAFRTNQTTRASKHVHSPPTCGTRMTSARRAVPARTRWRWAVVLAALVLLAACAPLPVHNPLATWTRSPNFNARGPMLIVLHFTNQATVQQSLDTLRTRNGGGPVSAHYVIGKDGHVYQLVVDTQRAWHAGPGRWGTITDVNSASIGVELDNDGQSPFPPAQIQSLLRLLADLTDRLHIPRSQIIGHEDMAPARKDDPGPRFPWNELAAAGFGLWPRGARADPPPGFDPWMALAAIGYPLDDRPAAVRAFHDHFRGIGGDELDPEDLRILYALVLQLDDY